MPLTWERAFGGPGHAVNPSGVELPNLEDPQRLIQGRGERRDPVCTGPISPLWPERARRAGTYDASYAKTHYPGLAADIDWEYFNSAPADQRIEGYWRGDEEIVLVNLLEGAPSTRTRLPGLTPRAFLTPAESADPIALLWEVPLRLDTIVVDGDARAVRCIWRGVLDVTSDDLWEMGSLCILSDPPGTKRTLDACRDVFRASMLAKQAEQEQLEATQAPAALALDEPLFKTLMGIERKWAHLDQAMTVDAAPDMLADVRALLEKTGTTLPPGALRSILERVPEDTGAPRPLDDAELRELEERVLAEERERNQGDALALREEVRRAVFEGRSCAGWDLGGVDLSRLRLSGGDFRRARFHRAVLAGTTFGDTDFTDAVFEEVELSDAELEGARFDRATFHFCGLERAHFRGASLDDARFTECLLRGARFSQTFARAAELLDSRIEDGTFDDSGANLTSASLHGTLLESATLVDTDLTAARRTDAAKSRAEDFVPSA